MKGDLIVDPGPEQKAAEIGRLLLVECHPRPLSPSLQNAR
jgi:hypothetical protein